MCACWSCAQILSRFCSLFLTNTILYRSIIRAQPNFAMDIQRRILASFAAPAAPASGTPSRQCRATTELSAPDGAALLGQAASSGGTTTGTPQPILESTPPQPSASPEKRRGRGHGRGRGRAPKKVARGAKAKVDPKAKKNHALDAAEEPQPEPDAPAEHPVAPEGLARDSTGRSFEKTFANLLNVDFSLLPFLHHLLQIPFSIT